VWRGDGHYAFRVSIGKLRRSLPSISIRLIRHRYHREIADPLERWAAHVLARAAARENRIVPLRESA
jgi:hypothetical protein